MIKRIRVELEPKETNMSNEMRNFDMLVEKMNTELEKIDGLMLHATEMGMKPICDDKGPCHYELLVYFQ